MVDTRHADDTTQGSPGTRKPREYRTEDIVVRYDVSRCLHAAECIRSLPSVFDTTRLPWIDPTAADPQDIAEAVRRCPSGALTYTLTGGEPEAPAHPTRVRRVAGGPLLMRGHLVITTPHGHVHATRAAMCACRHSGNQPFCDGSDGCLLSDSEWKQA